MGSSNNIIEKIKESPSEEEVIELYHDYLSKSIKDLEKSKGNKQPHNVQKIINITKEAARKISNPQERLFLTKFFQNLSEKYNLKLNMIILPAYEKKLLDSRKWKREDTYRLKQYIKRICESINQIANERIDNRFTFKDLYKRNPETSFFIEPFIMELSRMKFLSLEYYSFLKNGEEIKSKVIHLEDKWFSAKNIIDAIIKELESNGKILYETIQISKNSHIYW